MSVNKVILIGRVGKDPETNYMANGNAVTNLTLATSERWTDKAGEKQEKTEWHNISFFGKLAEIAGEYLTKGAMIYVEGKLTTRKWEDKDGNDRYTTSIIGETMKMLSGKRDSTDDSQPSDQKQKQAQKQAPKQAQKPPSNNSTGGFDNFDDDIPF